MSFYLQPSVAWISLEGFKLPDVSLDLGTCVTDTSKDLFDDTDEVNLVTWEISAKVWRAVSSRFSTMGLFNPQLTSAPAIIPATFSPEGLLRVEYAYSIFSRLCSLKRI
jgi:hypothetical protein